jgi:hypothetical protein
MFRKELLIGILISCQKHSFTSTPNDIQNCFKRHEFMCEDATCVGVIDIKNLRITFRRTALDEEFLLPLNLHLFKFCSLSERL